MIAFVVGAIALTVLPFLQRRMLKAPPPLGALSAFELSTMEGAPWTLEQMAGSVWVMGFVDASCDASCVKQQQNLAEVVRATADLEQPVKVLTFAVGEGELPPALRQLSSPGQWVVVRGTVPQLDGLLSEVRQALWKFRGEEARGVAPAVESLPGFVLVDQQGAIRGFWKSDELGRGNLINAARMLSRYGPNP